MSRTWIATGLAVLLVPSLAVAAPETALRPKKITVRPLLIHPRAVIVRVPADLSRYPTMLTRDGKAYVGIVERHSVRPGVFVPSRQMLAPQKRTAAA